ncbi:hypothetical protein ACC677_37495, partial [Rhizobium ruizarguesonis]
MTGIVTSDPRPSINGLRKLSLSPAIQSMLVGIGFFAIGVPAAGALKLVTFLMAVVQIPPLLLTLPVM